MPTHLDDGGEVGRAEGGRVVVDVRDVDVDRDSGEHGGAPPSWALTERAYPDTWGRSQHRKLTSDSPMTNHIKAGSVMLLRSTFCHICLNKLSYQSI